MIERSETVADALQSRADVQLPPRRAAVLDGERAWVIMSAFTAWLDRPAGHVDLDRRRERHLLRWVFSS